MNKTQSERLILDPDDTEQLTDIFAHCCPNAVIWAYGSRVGGNAHSGSDLDLAIKDLGANALSIPMIRSVLDESTLPFRVDLHVFDELPKPFHKEIEKKHVVFFEGIHQMFLNSFGKTFFSDSLFKMLHEHGTKVFTDPKEWDHSCNRQGRCPNLIGSHGHYEIKGHDDQERDVSSPEEKNTLFLLDVRVSIVWNLLHLYHIALLFVCSTGMLSERFLYRCFEKYYEKRFKGTENFLKTEGKLT